MLALECRDVGGGGPVGLVEAGEFLEAGQIGAGEEASGTSRADDHAAGGLGGQAGDRGGEVFEHPAGEHVLPMPRHREGEHDEAVVGPLDGQRLQIASARGHSGWFRPFRLLGGPKPLVYRQFCGATAARGPACPGRKQWSW